MLNFVNKYWLLTPFCVGDIFFIYLMSRKAKNSPSRFMLGEFRDKII